MIEFFENSLILITMLFIAGLLFLLFRKLTDTLRKYEKITLKTKKIINWGFVILVGLGVFSFYRQLTYRTPGTVFIEKITHIRTPKGTIILRDEYSNSFQDYSIECTVQFDQKGNTEYIQAIKSSPVFDPNHIESNDQSIIVESEKGIWFRTKSGYRFSLFNGNQGENIYFDTSARKLYYEGGSF